MTTKLSYKSGVGKLFTRRAIFEKNLTPRSALIGRAKKVYRSSDDLLFTDIQKKSLRLNLTAQSRKSVPLWSCRLGFDSDSGQTNDFKIGVHNFPA